MRHVVRIGTTRNEYRKKYESLRERKNLEDIDVNDRKKFLIEYGVRKRKEFVWLRTESSDRCCEQDNALSGSIKLKQQLLTARLWRMKLRNRTENSNSVKHPVLTHTDQNETTLRHKAVRLYTTFKYLMMFYLY